MATNYSLSDNPKTMTIEFHTDNAELYADVSKYIRNCIDAIRWNSRVDERKVIK
jgi:hypothetical protein